MLSRDAEHLYWLARYLERAENSARAVNVNGILNLDLPRGISPGWRPLVQIMGASQAFEAARRRYDERNVVAFLISDRKNPGSLVNAIACARQNTRVVRDMLPREVWEHLNGLYLYVTERADAGISKRERYDLLARVIVGIQTVTGIVEGTMLTGQGFHFLCAGRYLERADMTSRIVDVRSAELIPHQEAQALRPYENILWMSVLRSLTAYQMYRMKVRAQVNRRKVLEFLLQDGEFPRSVFFCASAVEAHLHALPANEAPLRCLARAKRQLLEQRPAEMDGPTLHDFLDRLQVDFGDVHHAVSAAYFHHEMDAPSGQS